MQTFEQIIEKYEGVIISEASKWIQHLWADMDDIKQEVYIIIFKRLDEILQMEDAGGYIRLITKNACRSMEYQEQKQLKDAQVSFGDENAFEGSFSSAEIGCIKSGYFEKRKKQSHEYYLKNKERCIERAKKWYQDNKEKWKEYYRKYYEEHKEELNERERKRYKENKERYKEYYKKYYWENAERIRERQREYARQNKEKIKEYNKTYRQKNREKLNEYQREYQREYRLKNKEKK